jgi:outer membrane protein TolC
MKKRTIWTTTLLLLATTSLFATPLSLEQALDLAMANNGTLKIADLTLKQTLREGEENIYLPTVSLTGGVETDVSISDSSISTSYSVGSVDFSLSSSDKYTKQQMALDSVIGQNTYESTVNTIQDEVTEAYWNLASAKLELEENQIVEKQLERTLAETTEQYENGLATTLDVNEAKLALSEAKITVQESESDVTIATDELNLLLGTEGDWELEDLPDTADPIELDRLLSLVGNTTGAKALAYAVEEATLALKTEQHSAYGPTVSFSASTGLSGTIDSSDSTFSDSTSFGVTVSVPLDAYLKNSSTQIDLDSLEYDIQIAQASYESGMAELRSETKSAYTTLIDDNAYLQTLLEYQALAQEQLDLVQASYDAGQSSFSDLEDSIDDLQQATLSVLGQKLDCILSLYDLCYLLETEPSVVTETN